MTPTSRSYSRRILRWQSHEMLSSLLASTTTKRPRLLSIAPSRSSTVMHSVTVARRTPSRRDNTWCVRGIESSPRLSRARRSQRLRRCVTVCVALHAAGLRAPQKHHLRKLEQQGAQRRGFVHKAAQLVSRDLQSASADLHHAAQWWLIVVAQHHRDAAYSLAAEEPYLDPPARSAPGRYRDEAFSMK